MVDTIHAQYRGAPQSSLVYTKSNTKCINKSLNYQPLKFQKFEGKDNPKQHITY